MDMEFVRKRITELRLMRGISEYQLSYDLGHSKNYIHNIVNGHSQPSVRELLYLMEVLGVTPQDFFNDQEDIHKSVLVREILNTLKDLNDADLEAVKLMVGRLKEKND